MAQHIVFPRATNTYAPKLVRYRCEAVLSAASFSLRGRSRLVAAVRRYAHCVAHVGAPRKRARHIATALDQLSCTIV